jgi:NADH-quinone oxidoreductase subunit N
MSFATVAAPHVAWEVLTPYLVLVGGSIATMLVALLPGRAVQRVIVPLVAFGSLIAAGVLFALTVGDAGDIVLKRALDVDDLARAFALIFIGTALVAGLLALFSDTLERFGRGEFLSLLIAVVLGMSLLAAAENLVTVFLSFELLSIPLYVLCAADLRRGTSLESGLKYLIIGSLGSATMLFGMAMIFGATGGLDFVQISDVIAHEGVASDALLLAGIALTIVGICFKAAIAPFHQWAPDVYQGAPTPVTTFMAIAVKAAAFALFLRFTAEAIHPAIEHWQTPLAVLAAITIVIGNLGALGQQSLKRMLAYSGIAQAGYLLVGVVVASELGARATVIYMVAYALMNFAPFAVIAHREREGAGEGYDAIRGIGQTHPELAWPMTISMFALAGLPITLGFMGKIFLILAAVDGGYSWLAVVVVLGSAASLAYYLRVVAQIWMGVTQVSSGERQRHPELVAVAVLAAAATILFGFWPGPVVDLAEQAAKAFALLIAG